MTTPGLLSDARKFERWWVSHYVKAIQLHPFVLIYQRNPGIPEKSRGKGGLATFLNEVAMHVDPSASAEWDVDPPEVVYLANWQTYVLTARMHDQILSGLDFDVPPRAEVIALPEWGRKACVMT